MYEPEMKKEVLEKLLAMLHEMMAKDEDQTVDVESAIADSVEATDEDSDIDMEGEESIDEEMAEGAEDEDLDDFEFEKRKFFKGSKSGDRDSATMKLKMAALPLPKSDESPMKSFKRKKSVKV